MDASRREFLACAAAFATLPTWAAAPVVSGFAKPDNPWERPDGSASDAVWARRVYLDLAGRIPTAAEAREFVGSNDPNKRIALVDRLLSGGDYADYWSMRLCDLLRVKSEFPINLWPNAVYVYHRYLRESVVADRPWNELMTALVTATGSDFRDAPSNYLRASADRTPEGLARTAVRTFLDLDLDDLPGQERELVLRSFSGVRFKSTREWKEELVYTDGPDRRGDFVRYLLGEKRPCFAAAFGGYIACWFFGRRGSDPEFGRMFEEEGFSLRRLCRRIVLSERYARGAVTGGFPLRRMDAEVLEDALRSILGVETEYVSIAPEPFTFLPKSRKSVLIEDGSISSAFLTRFGRPPRDSGTMDERSNRVTAKQRLYLFNSGRLASKLSRQRGDAEELYWRFLGRAPSDEERRVIRSRKVGSRELAWCLMNSREFLYRG